nr:unnamed protein product [Digitaria exilis]
MGETSGSSSTSSLIREAVGLPFGVSVILVLDAGGTIMETLGFYWVDDDGWIFLPTLWGDVDEAAVRKALDGPSDGRLDITAVRRCHHREARAVGFLDKMKGRGAHGSSDGMARLRKTSRRRLTAAN